MTSFRCPACGHDRGSPTVVFANRTIVACAECRLLSTSPALTPDEAKRLYAGEYYSASQGTRFQVPIAEAVMRLFRRRRARELARRMGGVRGKRILDVGCGRGVTLEALQRFGADVHGTQLSPAAARTAEQRLGPGRVFVGELHEARFPDASFDAVTLWHVLEHVSAPFDTLCEIARLLKPGGLAYIEVPHAGGWSARTFGAAWLAWDPDHHVSHFTPDTLDALARRAGLQPTAHVHLSIEYSPVTLVQTWLNALLGGDNTLFRAATSAGGNGPPASRAVLAAHAAAGAALFPLAVVTSLGLAARGVGDTFGVYLELAKRL